MTRISQQDRLAAERWWTALSLQIPAGVRGLWFGLAELAGSDQNRTTLYVAGTRNYDAKDASGDWATDVVWWPEARYLPLPVLTGDWEDVLSYACALLRLIVDPTELPATIDGIGAGWDDGDATIIWTRTQP